MLPMPGNLSINPAMPPILFICCSCSRRSSRSNPLPLRTFFASRSAFFLSTLRSTSSMRLSISPMPSIRDAIRSGWKGSRASTFSPTPRNLIGFPVMCRTESAAPPRASPSTLVRITPVRGNASLKALAVFTASWPIIASITNNVSTGLAAAWISLISAIMSSSIAKRPAVSIINTSMNCVFAAAIAALTMATGFSLTLLGKNSAPTSPASVFNCSMAAGR